MTTLMTASEYHQRVQLRLGARVGAMRVNPEEVAVIEMGWRYEVGADDCACQIIANRRMDEWDANHPDRELSCLPA